MYQVGEVAAREGGAHAGAGGQGAEEVALATELLPLIQGVFMVWAAEAVVVVVVVVLVAVVVVGGAVCDVLVNTEQRFARMYIV